MSIRNTSTLSSQSLPSASCHAYGRTTTTSSSLVVGPALPLLLAFVILCGSCLLQVSHADQKFCGRELTEALDLVCVNGYNNKLKPLDAMRKRKANDFNTQLTSSNELFDSEWSESESKFPNTYAAVVLSPFLANMYVNVLAKTRRQRDNGVYDECCRKPCSYSELAAYCRPSQVENN